MPMPPSGPAPLSRACCSPMARHLMPMMSLPHSAQVWITTIHCARAIPAPISTSMTSSVRRPLTSPLSKYRVCKIGWSMVYHAPSSFIKQKSHMTQFLVRRLFLVLPVLLGILMVTFIITRLVPGDPCYVMLGEHATEATCNDFKARFGLDKSIPEQFVRYVFNIMRGDFGNSLKDRRPITTIIGERLPMTIELTILAMMFASTFGILLGVDFCAQPEQFCGHVYHDRRQHRRQYARVLAGTAARLFFCPGA